jgi:hypothetical protein
VRDPDRFFMHNEVDASKSSAPPFYNRTNSPLAA